MSKLGAVGVQVKAAFRYDDHKVCVSCPNRGVARCTPLTWPKLRLYAPEYPSPPGIANYLFFAKYATFLKTPPGK